MLKAFFIFFGLVAEGATFKKFTWLARIKRVSIYMEAAKRWQDHRGQNLLKRYAASVIARYPENLHWWEKLVAPIIVHKITGTIANFVSIIRILLAIIVGLLMFIGLSAGPSGRIIISIIALLIFTAAGLGDFVDGWAARAFNEVSELGKIIDPLADKLLFASILLINGYRYLPTILFWAVVGLESFLMFITILKKIVHRLPIKMATQANLWGKWKNVFELTGGGFLFLTPLLKIFGTIAIILVAISVPLAIGSIAGYLSSVRFKKF